MSEFAREKRELRQIATHGPRGHRRAIRELHLLRSPGAPSCREHRSKGDSRELGKKCLAHLQNLVSL